MEWSLHFLNLCLTALKSQNVCLEMGPCEDSIQKNGFVSMTGSLAGRRLNTKFEVLANYGQIWSCIRHISGGGAFNLSFHKNHRCS